MTQNMQCHIKLKSLIVNDSSIVRNALMDMIDNSLEGTHIVSDVLESEDAENGLADLCAYSDDLDIIFLDWNLPDVNGAKLVSLVRDNEDFDRVRIIVTVSQDSKDEVKDVRRMGVYGCLTKPFVQEDVCRVLRQFKDRM
jgi:two-component system chemotaxis response regulator CheY